MTGRKLPHNLSCNTNIHPKHVTTHFNPKLTIYGVTKIAAYKALFRSDAEPASGLEFGFVRNRTSDCRDSNEHASTQKE